MHTSAYHGRECQAHALGQTWTFSRWTIDILDDWTDWARHHLPDPIAKANAEIERMMEEEEGWVAAARTDADKEKLRTRLKRRAKMKDELVTAAMKQATSYLDFTSAEVQSLLHSIRGTSHLCLLLMQRHHPDITEERAFEIVTALPEDEIGRIWDVTSGKAPPAPKNDLAPAA